MIWETAGTEAAYGNNGWASSIPRWDTDHKMHLDGMNVTYGDGHVKWSSISNVIAQTGGATGTSVSTAACNLALPSASIPNCSRMFNPFRP